MKREKLENKKGYQSGSPCLNNQPDILEVYQRTERCMSKSLKISV
jgi:hypothetical protein